METIIPILIAAVVFGLQAYANYQKEQEKARKRNPGQRPPSATTDMPPSGDGMDTELPIPDYWDEKPVKQPDARRNVSKEEWHSFDRPQSVPAAFEEYTGTLHAEDVKRVRRTHKQPIKPLQVAEDVPILEGEAVSANDFDLRDAVIKAAILERPYR